MNKIVYNSVQLRKSSSLSIQPEAIYRAIKDTFKGEEPMLAHRSIVGKQFQWTVPTIPGETWQRIGDASSMEIKMVLDAISAYKQKVKASLGLSDDDVNAIFTTPDDNNCIYYSLTGGVLKVSIAAWDFVSAGEQVPIPPIPFPPLPVKQNVNVGFEADGQLVGGIQFELKLPSGYSNMMETATNGLQSLNELIVGSSVHIYVPDRQKDIVFTVALGQENYIFDISEPKPVQVTPVLVVLDRDGNPLDAYPVGLQLPGGDSRQVNTDANGEYQLPTMDEGEQFTVTDGGTTGQSETFVAEAGKEKYYFKLDYMRPAAVSPVLVVLDRDGNPLGAYPVGLQLPGGDNLSIETDGRGEYHLPEMHEGDQFTVTDGGSTGRSETFTVESGKDKYYFKLDYAKPVPVSPTLVVLDRDGNPLDAYPIDLQLPGGDSLHIETDGSGEYHLPEMHEGDQFTAIDGGNTERSETFTVESGKDKYYFKLDYSKPGPPPPPVPVTPTLIVIDSDDNPVSSFPIDLQLPGGQSSHVFTGEKGEYVLPTILVGDQFTATDSFSGHSETFVVEEGKDTYYFKLNYVPTEQNADITIKVVDEDGKPIYPGRLSFTQNGSTFLFDLPQNGTIGLSQGTFQEEVSIEVKLVDSGNKEYRSANFRLVPGETQYMIQLDSADCPAWKKVVEVLCVVGVAAGAAFCYPFLWDFLTDLVLKTY